MSNTCTNSIGAGFFEECVAEQPSVPKSRLEAVEVFLQLLLDASSVTSTTFEDLEVRIIPDVQLRLDAAPNHAVFLGNKIAELALYGDRRNLSLTVRTLARRTLTLRIAVWVGFANFQN